MRRSLPEQVGDIYESYALAVFGGLVMRVLCNRITTGDEDEDEQRMHASLGSITVAGIMLFFWVCLFQAVYQLFVTTMVLAHLLIYTLYYHCGRPYSRPSQY